MTTTQFPQPEPQQPPPSPPTVRKLIIELIDARDLLPKDGLGSSSAYVVVDFDGQKKRTSTVSRNLNPAWNESLEFIVSDPKTMEFEEIEIEVFNDKKLSHGNARKNHFLGRVKLYGSQFAKRGDEGLIYFQLEKKSVFSWIRGEIGLRIYYYDEILVQEQIQESGQNNTNPNNEPPPGAAPTTDQKPQLMAGDVLEAQMPPILMEGSQSPPLVTIQESPPTVTVQMEHHHFHQQQQQQQPNYQDVPPVIQPEIPPEMRKMSNERVRVLRRHNGGEYSPRVISGKLSGEKDRIPAYDLVEPMQYLFIRIVKARGLSQNGSSYVKIRTSSHFVRSKPASFRPGEPSPTPEWHQVFALGYNKTETANSTLEISVWDGPSEQFLGGVCFDLSDVTVRDPPDSPLAPQWYRLEGSDDPNSGRVSGDIQLSVWIGTQADDSFPESWSSDAPYVAHTRSKVYQSPKLWYLRLTVIEAQDLQIAANLPPLTAPEVRVKAQLGFQSVRTRRGSMNHHSSSFYWHEDLVFVAGEPLEDTLIVLVEDRTGKDPVLLGHVVVPVGSIEQRLDERNVATKWFGLEGGSGGSYTGRIHLRMCLEGGYHVLDEAAHVCSDFRPTAKQLWKPPVGILELGILGARGLLPMKSNTGGKGSTDAFCVAKYGKKWVRTRTIPDSFEPRWNEQYTWQVYDPCTVLTIGVFDNWRMFADTSEEKPDCRIGKIRIRVSTLESNKVYTNSYPLLVLQRTGLKKMGEIEIAVRFACPSLLPDTCAVYGQPLLPRMHYLRPLGVAQQEALRGAAIKMVAAWLTRSEPQLGPEVVRYMLASPPLEQVRKRPNYGSSRKDSPLAGMHRRYDIYEYMDMNADADADANAGLMKEFEYIHNTSRVIREDLDGMLGQQPMGLEDGTGQGMYSLPTDMGPTSKNNKPGGNMSSASVKMGLDSFKDNRVQYSDPLLPEKFSVMEQYDKGEKPMFHSRDAPYTMVPASQSKDFMANSQFKDFASTSSGKLRTNFRKPYWDGVPLPADDYFGVSVKPTERMGFSGYGERHDLGSGRNSEVDDRREPFSPTGDEHHNYMYNRVVLGESDILDIGRDPKAEGKNQTFYKRDTFSPTRTDRRDYLYPRLGVRETDDYPSDEVYRRMSERIDYDSRPNMGPVTERYGTTEFGRRNLTHSSLWNHPSLEKQPFPNQVGMRRSSTASKEVGQYLDSVTANVEFGRKVSREEEIPYLGNSKDRDMMLPMISNYSLGRDAGPIYHKERMRRSPEFQHETEMRRLSVRNLGIKGEEYDTYNPSNRVPKRKYSTDEEIDWHDPRNIMSTKWNSSSRTQDLDDRGEEWIGQQRSSYLSKRAACGRENNRRAEMIFDRTDERRVSAYEDRSASHEPAEHVLGHSMKPHKSGDRYFKGNSKPGSQSWYSSYHYSRKNVLPKPNNVWIRSKDGNQGDVHAKEVEQSENRAISAKSELTEDSDEFKQLVHSYFLSFTRKLNDNPAVRKRYKEQGRAGSLFCIVCGRSESKEFTDTQRLATHAFMSHKHGLRAQHSGLHKAICVLLGWNSVVAPDVVTWYPETISNAEALAQKEDLIIWPPVIVIHNSSTSGHDSERQRGITVEALEDFLRGKGVSGGKVKIGNPANHSIMLVKFLGTFSGLQDAEKLQKYFTENKRGRIDFEKIAFGKGKSSKSGEGKKGGKLDELVLYGYMGIAEDLDQIDYDTKRKCSIKSKREIQDIADAPVKPE